MDFNSRCIPERMVVVGGHRPPLHAARLASHRFCHVDGSHRDRNGSQKSWNDVSSDALVLQRSNDRGIPYRRNTSEEKGIEYLQLGDSEGGNARYQPRRDEMLLGAIPLSKRNTVADGTRYRSELGRRLATS